VLRLRYSAAIALSLYRNVAAGTIATSFTRFRYVATNAVDAAVKPGGTLSLQVFVALTACAALL